MRCKCPFIVAVDVGNHFLMAFIVNPGTPSNWSFFTAFTSVLAGGEKTTGVDIQSDFF